MKKLFNLLHPIFFKPQRSSAPLSVSSWSWEDLVVPPMQTAEPSHKKKDSEPLLHKFILLLAAARSSHAAQGGRTVFFPHGLS